MKRLLSLVLFVVAVAGASVDVSGVSAADTTVTIDNFAFAPASVTVRVGDTVTWSNNQAGVPHTATSDSGAFNTGNIAGGGTAAVTFNSAGTFPYTCAIHPDMHGTVVVQAAAVTATSTATSSASPQAPTVGTGTTPGGEETPWLIAGAVVALIVAGAAGAALVRRRS